MQFFAVTFTQNTVKRVSVLQASDEANARYCIVDAWGRVTILSVRAINMTVGVQTTVYEEQEEEN